MASAAAFYCRLPSSVSGGAAAVVDVVPLVDGAAVKTAAGALLVCILLLAGVAATKCYLWGGGIITFLSF